MRALFITASIMAASSPALADDTFESQAQAAVRVAHVDDLVWPFIARCDAGTDTQQRQCRQVRDARAAELRGRTVLVDGEPGAFKVGDWDPQRKSAAVTLQACIACTGLEVDADGAKKTWFVAGARDASQPARFQGGVLVGPTLSETSRTFADAATAKKYAQSLGTVRTQFLVKVPATPVWTDRDRRGVALDVVGYRVFTPCTGAVVIASPAAAGNVEADKKSCAKPAAK